MTEKSKAAPCVQYRKKQSNDEWREVLSCSVPTAAKEFLEKLTKQDPKFEYRLKPKAYPGQQ